MDRTKNAETAIMDGVRKAYADRSEYVTPEHLLHGLFQQPEIVSLFESFHQKVENYKPSLDEYFKTLDTLPAELGEYDPEASVQLTMVMLTSEANALNAGKSEVDITHIMKALYDTYDSLAGTLLRDAFQYDCVEMLRALIAIQDGRLPDVDLDYGSLDADFHDNDDDDDGFEMLMDGSEESTRTGEKEKWKRYVTCVNDILDTHNPLIGRETELDRTIQVLCRCDKNNPLHVGEPGVGKTALVYGLAQRIKDGAVPERLKNSRIYMLDMGTLVAGTQYRGQFEERLKAVMQGASKEDGTIIYIDEIHTMVGAGSTSDSSLDASNMMKPYLEAGTLRFIGSTTYKEFNRYIQKSQGLVRRFQIIDINEPSREEAIGILKGLKSRYEKFHALTYDDDVIPYVVDMSMKYVHDRFLPDKAIDLLDEAGAYREMHPLMRKLKGRMTRNKRQFVDKALVTDILSKVCKVSTSAIKSESRDKVNMQELEKRISARIFGQDEAVRQVTMAVLTGKAGLIAANKPLGSLLFVGPTGVGKTELCKVLAKELGVEFIRFDMSEYSEKHSVAKLIGSPAGYVGYEDGGLLVDAIRRSPNCVLLLDEIEKAHSDVYNILLQVMDYAQLTDNKGLKADFSHVVFVMTSNAGAQYASQASVGFNSQVTAGKAMLAAVKKLFKPEFLGRLTDIVVFNSMTREMAVCVLHKKLEELRQRLASNNAEMELTQEALDVLLQQGFTQENGAREMDRAINNMLVPLLTHELLFGSLQNGGKILLTASDGKLVIAKYTHTNP